MKNVLSIYKPVGLTPLEVIEKLRIQNPTLKDEKLGYAGRLDPMAEGLLVVLIGDENIRRKDYERMTKTYQFEVLFGVSTDSYDILGIPTLSPATLSLKTLQTQLPPLIHSLIGTQNQPYPPYSSPRINGKPLFYYAREGRLSEITIPTKTIEVYSTQISSFKQISTEKLLNYVNTKIDLVKGDFRQEMIKAAWKKLLDTSTRSFPLVQLSLSCSSGTYIRSIANTLGKNLGTEALAYSIQRTQVGEFTLESALRIT